MAETGIETQAAAQAPDAPIPLAHQLPVYAAGVFSNGSAVIASVIVPLWMLQIDPSPLLVGIALGARQLLPVLLSIHGGALMDRIGIRRVMLWFAVTGAVVPFLFPLFPYFAAVVLLQALSGIASTMGWIGTQAQIGAIMKGETRYAGRVTFFNRFAILAGPPAIGAAWDIGGPWGGFGFLGFWGIALLLACIALPKPKDGDARRRQRAACQQITLRDVLPRPGRLRGRVPPDGRARDRLRGRGHHAAPRRQRHPDLVLRRVPQGDRHLRHAHRRAAVGVLGAGRGRLAQRGLARAHVQILSRADLHGRHGDRGHGRYTR